MSFNYVENWFPSKLSNYTRILNHDIPDKQGSLLQFEPEVEGKSKLVLFGQNAMGNLRPSLKYRKLMLVDNFKDARPTLEGLTAF